MTEKGEKENRRRKGERSGEEEEGAGRMLEAEGRRKGGGAGDS